MWYYVLKTLEGLYPTGIFHLTLLHSERPKLYRVLAFLSVIGLNNLIEMMTLSSICVVDEVTSVLL